ncbi:MAG: NAD(P)H-hydrate dehydratase [Enterocloster sp.]
MNGSVVVLGPGLGSEPYVEYLVEDILTSAYVPVTLDADGLKTIASHPYLTSYYTENIIITPLLLKWQDLQDRPSAS